ncbi:MAG: hypothetical protein JST81_12830 [Bacteroidetes bacterium]|nr:hypothetical protein [Bacteroidota bacterium]
MRIIIRLLFLSFSLFITLSTFSQVKKPAPKSNETLYAKKFKPPKLHTMLDKYKDSTSISVEEALRIIDLPLTIHDDKNTAYTISSYQFLYRKKGVTEDEAGNLSPTSTISSDRFKVSPLPPLWINIIKEQVKSGEEFYFFDVIAKDSHGKVMYASNLKLMIR